MIKELGADQIAFSLSDPDLRLPKLPNQPMDEETATTYSKEDVYKRQEVSGFMLATVAREIMVRLGEQYLQTGSPKNLTLMQAAGMGNNKDQAIYEMSYEGLFKRYITGHFANNSRMIELTNENKIEAYNFPQEMCIRDSI